MVFEENNSIIIVTGLPRSGTSMMMQLLQQGGMTVLTDEIRQQDVNNPKGYFEYEKVKTLASDNSWLPIAQGKAVKIISHFIELLPSQYNYKIILMQRPIEEVLLSQQKMLGKETTAIPTMLKDIFNKQLEQCKQYILQQKNMELLIVNYPNVINKPNEEIKNIMAFLHKELNTNAMLSVVDKNLHRNKVNSI